MERTHNFTLCSKHCGNVKDSNVICQSILQVEYTVFSVHRRAPLNRICTVAVLPEFRGYTCDNCQPASISERHINHWWSIWQTCAPRPACSFLCRILLQTDSDVLNHFSICQLVDTLDRQRLHFI